MIVITHGGWWGCYGISCSFYSNKRLILVTFKFFDDNFDFMNQKHLPISFETTLTV